MATDEIRYIPYPEAVMIHVELMRLEEKTRYGVFNRGLIESALARPQQAAAYEEADIFQSESETPHSLARRINSTVSTTTCILSSTP